MWIPRAQRDTPLLRLSADDPAAFHAFYCAYIERVVSYFARRTFDPEAALDLAGETFARALERRAQFRGSSVEQEQGWLFAIAHNVLVLYLKRGEVERAALQRLGLDPPSQTSADLEWVERMIDLPELQARIREAIDVLPDDQAYAVQARVVDERSYLELAAELQVSEQVVRARVSRGLRTLARTHPRLKDLA